EAVVPEAQAAMNRALGTIESDARAAGRKMARIAGEPMVFHRGPSTGNQVQPAEGRIFPRSERLRLEMEAAKDAPVWTGVLQDRKDCPGGVAIAVEADRLHAGGRVTGGAGGEVADRTFQRVGGAAQRVGVALGDGLADVVHQPPAVLEEQIDQALGEIQIVA